VLAVADRANSGSGLGGIVLAVNGEKTKLMNRVRRLRGQVDAIERALEMGINCSETLQLIASVRGAMNGLMAEVMEEYIRTQVVGSLRERDPMRTIAAEKLIEVIQRYLK
jgi:FrmR/RcnR family transcriptional regulator, repressor of frmRAB operon